MKRIIILSLGSWLLSFAFSSCSKFVEVDLPIGQFTTEFVYADSTTTVGSVTGIYAQMASGSRFLNGTTSLFTGLSADELVYLSTSAIYIPLYMNSLTADNASLYTYWQTAFNQVYMCNLAIEKLPAATSVRDSLKNQLIGEAKFLRALHFFYLYNQFGPVPLTLTSDYTVNATMPRTDSNTIYRQIIADLKEAQGLLWTKYATTEKVRANRYAADALLARVYLYRKEYDSAITEASKVIESGPYTMTALANTFLANNAEAILQLVPPITGTTGAAEGASILPTAAAGTGKPSFTVTDSLYKAFTAGDLRLSAWIKVNTVSSVAYAFPYKYKVRNTTAGVAKTEYSVLLRLAEQYLIRAEAYANKGNLAAAITDIDVIRSRAGLSKIATTNPGISQQDLLTAIFQERRLELFTECGHRWLDLKRTGQAAKVLSPMKAPNWEDTDVLYPIPSAERAIDKALTQNPGYSG